MRYQEYSSQKQAANWRDFLNSAYQATIDTGPVWMSNAVINLVCQTAHHLSQRVTQNGWSRTGKALKFSDDYAGFGVYAHSAVQQGVVISYSQKLVLLLMMGLLPVLSLIIEHDSLREMN